MLPPTLNTLLFLALTTPFLATPLPRRDITVRYTSDYPKPPGPHIPPPKKDTFEEDLIPSPSSNDIEDILSIQKPLPSIFLIGLSKLRREKGTEERGVSQTETGTS